MKKIYSVAEKVSSVVVVISCAAFIVSMLLTVCDVFLRKVTNNAIYGSYELMELLMVCLVFAAFAYTQVHKGFTRVGMFIKLFPHAPKMIIFSINEILTVVISGCVTYAAYLQIGYAIKKNLTTANLYIPLYPFYALEMVCMGVLTLVLLLDAIYSVMAIFNKDYAADIMSHV